MKVEYSISAEDYLNFQLFSASQSEEIKKRRKNTRIIFTLLNIAVATYFFADKNTLLGIAFIAFAIVWFFITPVMQGNAYKKKYKEYISNHFNNRFDKIATLEISDQLIVSKDPVSTGSVPTNDILTVIEVPTATYIKFKDGKSFILPKSSIVNYREMVLKLEEIAQQKGFLFQSNLNWKWK